MSSLLTKRFSNASRSSDVIFCRSGGSWDIAIACPYCIFSGDSWPRSRGSVFFDSISLREILMGMNRVSRWMTATGYWATYTFLFDLELWHDWFRLSDTVNWTCYLILTPGIHGYLELFPAYLGALSALGRYGLIRRLWLARNDLSGSNSVNASRRTI